MQSSVSSSLIFSSGIHCLPVDVGDVGDVVCFGLLVQRLRQEAEVTISRLDETLRARGISMLRLLEPLTSQ